VSDVAVSASGFPLGVFANTISGGGNASVARESIFSTGCVFNRKLIDMSGIDAAYGIPVGVHSSEIITESNGSGQYCPDTNKPIHEPGSPCNVEFPNDQDRLGASLAGTDARCESVQTTYPDYYGKQDLDGDGTTDVHGSLVRDRPSLFALFGINSPPLSAAQVDEMRSLAQAQGNYWTAPTGWSDPDEANAVMFFDLAPGTNATVNLNDVDGFGRPANLGVGDAACTTKSLTIIVVGGNARLNSNQQLAASLFLLSVAPDGQITKANGTANFIGTIYADNVDMSGSLDVSLDPCFMSNLSPSLLDFELGAYRELDR
jgi:hypothetical protein